MTTWVWAQRLVISRSAISSSAIVLRPSRAHLPVYVRRHLTVMLSAEGSWQLHLNRLRGRKSPIQAGALAGQRLVPLVSLIRCEDRLGLAVRPEGDWSGRRAPAPETGQDS